MATQTLESKRENVTPAAAPKTTTLTPLDRCDRCGARAQATATLGDLTLLFCSHDIHKNGEKLQASGFEIEPSNWREHLDAN